MTTSKDGHGPDSDVKQTIAFLGTGIMGAPMCGHILDAGYRVNVWNRSADKAASLSAQGALLCKLPNEAVSGAKVVVIMLSSGAVVDEILFERDTNGESVEMQLDKGVTVIVMSSIPVESSRQQSARLAKRDVRYIDAPVSGGEKGAVDANLSIMAGGDGCTIANAQDLLSTMGRVTHVGKVGCGQLVKLANQIIVGITIDAVAEALLLAKAGGAELVAVHEALVGGFADSTILRQHGLRMIKQDFAPGARASIQLKDLRTSRALAESLGLDLPALKLAESLYRDMCNSGRDDLDHSALFLQIADRSNS